MAVTALFRIQGGEVLKVSLKGQPFDDRDQTYWGVLTDPPRPDGDQVRDLSGEDPGPLRVLGFAKVNDAGTVRNATQPEIDAFVVAEDEDEKDLDAADATSLLNTHLQFRKAFKALALVMLDEINILRDRHTSGPSPLEPRTRVQLLAAVSNKVDRED